LICKETSVKALTFLWPSFQFLKGFMAVTMAKLAESAFVLKVFAKQVPIKASGLIFYYKCEDTNLTWLF